MPRTFIFDHEMPFSGDTLIIYKVHGDGVRPRGVQDFILYTQFTKALLFRVSFLFNNRVKGTPCARITRLNRFVKIE